MPALSSLAIGLGVAGAASGVLGSVFGGDSSKTTRSESGVELSQANSTEMNAEGTQNTALYELQQQVGAGAGLSDVAASTKSQRDLASLFGQASQNGGLPGQQDINASQSFAQQIFNPQRVALQQNLQDQSQAAARSGALMGRSANDPILRAKLAQEQTRQQQTLEANQGAYSAQYANQLQNNRLDLASQQTNILGGLATQAMQNRQNLLALGNTIKQQEQQFRLATAKRYGTNTETQNVGVGDRISAGLSGALSGFSGGMNLAGGFQGMQNQQKAFGQSQQMGAAQIANTQAQTAAYQQMAQPPQQNPFGIQQGFGPGQSGIPGINAFRYSGN